jgi:branched-chain amino acid transport system substrate-binding protein
LNSGAALVAEPITNKAHLVMVSPANTNPTLTDPKSRSSQEPATASKKLKYVSYYRTVTTDTLQGPAGAEYAHNKLKAHSYFLVNDTKQYGVGLATYFEAEANKLKMSRSGAGQIDPNNIPTTSQALASEIELANPDIVYCGCDSETSNLLAYDLRNGGYKKPFVAGDAIVNNPDWLNSTTDSNPGAGIGAANTGGTQVGPAHAAKFFPKLYKKYAGKFYSKYGEQPYDATSYDAAGALLTAIYNAAKGGKLKGNITAKRTAVVNAMHSVTFKGATGTTSFDKNGDTKNKIISIYATKTVNKALTWVFEKQLKPTGSPT